MSSEINKYNAAFLKTLSGKEWIGVDENGLLFKVTGLSRLLYLYDPSIYTKGLDKSIQDAIQEAFAKRHIKTNTPLSKTRHDKIVTILNNMGVLSDKNRMLVVNDYYNERYESLIKTGSSPFVSESIVSIEMYHDPNILPFYKEKLRPELTSSGVNGTYFIKNRGGEKIGIFKPSDEEVDMPNNPRNSKEPYNSQKPKRHDAYKGHEQGTGWKKEIAASLIDKQILAGVPETVKISVPFLVSSEGTEITTKIGSLQKFVKGVSAETLDYESLQKLPIEQVHKMAVLDLLIGNADRNFGNFFWNGTKIIPIDHGFSLLDSLDWREEGPVRSEMNCLWHVLPQTKEPLSKSLINKVLSFNPLNMSQKLVKELDLSESNVREFFIRTSLCKKAIEKGLNLSQITEIMMLTRKDCLIEKVCNEAIIECEKNTNQWNTLPTKEKEQKRFDIYLKLVHNIFNQQLRNIK